MFDFGAVRSRAVVTATLLLTVGTLAEAQKPSRGALVSQIDSLATAALRNGPVAGLSVAVVKGQDTLVMKGYGLADVENDVPATASTVYRIGSITKQFTSAAVMQLVEQGKVNLDDDLTKYFPNFPTHGQRILVRHLLNHTSGIPSYTDIPGFGRVITLDLPHDSLLAMVGRDSLMFAPGSGFYYNNSGYYMLGVLIEKVTGRKYGDYLTQHLFEPLGLHSTYYCATAPLIKHRAQGYATEKGKLVNASYIDMGLPFAAGSLCSTVGDLVKWEHALFSGKVVSATSLAQMTTPAKLTSNRPMPYGFGLAPDTVGGHRAVGHGGGINGFISHEEIYPSDSLTVVVLANTAPAPSQGIARNAARLVLGLPLMKGPSVPTEIALDSAQRARYVGNYSLQNPDASRVPARVVDENGHLMLEAHGQRGQLLAVGPDVFAVKGQPGARVMFTLSNGKATEFLLDQGMRPLAARRIE
ncbi:MAG TPA: serine hydrolase domain-containing protein [Gemmatimonadaceae bacterium]|jgi:CubicO group peptidase (beta-lactamase class C family)